MEKESSHKINRIKIGFGDCLEVEIESEELNFLQLKTEALQLLEIAKKIVTKAPADKNEVA